MLTLLIFSFLTSFCAYSVIVFLLYTLVSESIVSSSAISTILPILLVPSARIILPITIFSPVYLVYTAPTNLTFSIAFPKVLILVVSLTLNSDVYSFIYLIRLFSSTTSSSRILPSSIYAFHSSIGILVITSLEMPSYLTILISPVFSEYANTYSPVSPITTLSIAISSHILRLVSTTLSISIISISILRRASLFSNDKSLIRFCLYSPL